VVFCCNVIFVFMWQKQRQDVELHDMINEKVQKPPIARFSQDQPRFLDSNQVAMIDEALASLGDFGEVRLIVEKGRLRFLVTQKSFDAQKWQPGAINANEE
jgi:hypothetical protein